MIACARVTPVGWALPVVGQKNDASAVLNALEHVRARVALRPVRATWERVAREPIRENLCVGNFTLTAGRARAHCAAEGAVGHARVSESHTNADGALVFPSRSRVSGAWIVAWSRVGGIIVPDGLERGHNWFLRCLIVSVAVVVRTIDFYSYI